MPKMTYSTVVTLTLDRPIEEFGRRDLRKHIGIAIKKWGKALPPSDPYHSGIIDVEVSQFKDADLSQARSHGGRARAESLTARQRSKIASAAARARWDKVKKEN